MIKVEADIPNGELLDPLDDVSEVLSDIPRKHIHIIVRRPLSMCNCIRTVGCADFPSGTVTGLKYMIRETIGDDEKRLQLDERTFQRLSLLVLELTLLHSPEIIHQASSHTTGDAIYMALVMKKAFCRTDGWHYCQAGRKEECG
jgi:hypothetical protein